MMKGWNKVRLDEFVKFQRGFDLPKNNFKKGNVPVYGSTSILGYHNVAKVKAPGVITGRSGTLGRFQYAKQDFWPHNTSLWVKDFKGNDTKFAYFLMQCLDFADFNSGGAVPTLNRNVLRSFKVDVPPLPTQQRIAKILSAYDDLIENNLKRIKLLEEMAQITYEEWFVRFKFPGYETAKFDKETGLPEGWKKDIADKIFNIKIGKTPPRGETHWFNTKKSLKWASIKDMRKSNFYLFNTNETIDEKAITKFNFNIAKLGTVILSFKLTVGLVSIVNENIVTNEAIAHFNNYKNSLLSNEYTYLYLRNFNYDQMGSTSSIGTAINSKIVKRIPFLIPYSSVLKSFNEIITPFFENIKNMQSQNQRLKEARDILLPRLMTGVINADVIFVETYGRATLCNNNNQTT